MLSIKTVQRLKKLGIEANKVQDFANGIKLLQLVCQVYYNGENPALSAKIKMIDEAKTGVYVLNINILLNYIKKDPNIQLPQELRDITAFKLLQESQSMIGLIDFLLSQASTDNKRDQNHEMSPARQQQNDLQNLYFVGSIEKKVHIDDSLQMEDHSEKVVRKGSFKVLKPRASSDSKRQTSGSRDSSNEKKQIEDNVVINRSKKEPLKQIYNIQPNYIQVEQAQQLIARKTIPKMLQRPPLYRSRQRDSAQSVKQKNQSSNNDKKHTPLMTASQTDRQTIIKNIQHINFQIAQQQKSINLINSSINQSRVEQTKSRSRSMRKVFKIDLPEVNETVRKRLLEWLIGINILGLKAAKYINQLQNICKDGVIFIQIINYYRGRGKNISYFKEPKRNAQIHSNYQKLFTVLQEYINFRSQLLHQYEFFIPQAHPLAFWNLLLSIYQCFNRQNRPKVEGINRYQNSVSKVVEKSSRKKISQTISYNQLKLNNNSQSKDKKDVKSNFSSIQLPRKQTPKPVKSMKSHQSQERNIPYGLVQNEQPQQQNVRTQRGYKQLYLCKFKNMETPSKNRSFTINSSLTKSRIRSSLGSAKKNQAKPALPSITLQMQMGVLKYLKSYPVEDENIELFKDPYRNGVLICTIIQKEWMVDCYASRRPKNIDDCRNNFLNAIELIKNKLKNMKISYEYFVQDLLKGEKSLLYGLIWTIIKEPIQDGKSQQPQPFSYIELQDKSLQKSLQSEQKISWVRQMEKHSSQIALMRIRTQQQLYSAVLNTDFLFYYSYFITGKKSVTPNYQRPINYIQKESNLKKILSFLVQSKIIRSDYLWKSKYLLKRQGTILEELVSDLITHFNRLYKKNQMKAVNFIKYIRPEQSQEKQKPIEKLETTMANQTINNHHSQIMTVPQLQINWMRKLGFGQSLQLNNGVLLCRLLAKLMMKSINGLNENPQTRAECLGNIRKAIKLLPKFKWDEYDVLESDYNRNLQIYAFLRDQFKHSYALRSLI